MGNGIIRLKKISFNYDGQVQPIFDKVDLEIDASWKLGLIGRNGRGKTTLMKILRQQVEYDGEVETNLKFNYFPAEVQHPDQSLQMVLMEITGRDYSDFWEVERELDQIGLDDAILKRPYCALSPGQQTKALLAAMFADRDSFQLIDEPTNHLDASGRGLLATYLKQKQGFIVISHDRHFLNQVIDHVISIDRAQISSFKGNYETWATARQNEDQQELNADAKLRKDIKKLEAASHQKQEWSRATEREKAGAPDKGFIGHKSAKVMSKALNLRDRAEQKVADKKQLLKNLEVQDELQLNYRPAMKAQQKALLNVEEVVVQRAGQRLNQPVSFTLKIGERIVIAGGNGAGKSTLLAAILGDTKLLAEGQSTIRPALKVSYLPQDFDQLQGTLTEFANEKQVEVQQLLAMLRKLGFDRTLFDQRIEQLSMGQKRKVALARSLCEEANLYIWDEPLNYLDVITRQQIEDVVLKFNLTLLLVDHDQTFIEKVGTKVVNLNSEV
jgi:lincosamide and streptogramin A transport system ATP-binding/permease protein